MGRSFICTEKQQFFDYLGKNFLKVTYDDVTLKTGYSSTMPENVDISTNFSKNIRLEIPIVSAAMDTVTESQMAIALARLGGLGIVHRNMSVKSQVAQVQKVKDENLQVGAAIGVGEESIDRARELIKVGADVLVIDTAHADSKPVYDTVSKIKKEFKVDLVVGNVTEPDSVKRLCEAKVDGIKIGQGPGSICTTRVIAGIGAPQLSAIFECAKVARKYKVPICADGGLNYPGDVTKAIAAGANCVMMGKILAGVKEAPGKVIKLKDGRKVKKYRGMGSYEAMTKFSSSRQRYQQSNDSTLVPEGVEGVVNYKGEVSKVLDQYIGGLRKGMGYIGASSINELISKGKFQRITNSSSEESHTRVNIVGKRVNY